MKNDELPVIAQRFASCKERLRDVSIGQRPMQSQASLSYAERETNLVPVRAVGSLLTDGRAQLRLSKVGEANDEW